jgi:hypothetical protein
MRLKRTRRPPAGPVTSTGVHVIAESTRALLDAIPDGPDMRIVGEFPFPFRPVPVYLRSIREPASWYGCTPLVHVIGRWDPLCRCWSFTQAGDPFVPEGAD